MIRMPLTPGTAVLNAARRFSNNRLLGRTTPPPLLPCRFWPLTRVGDAPTDDPARPLQILRCVYAGLKQPLRRKVLALFTNRARSKPKISDPTMTPTLAPHLTSSLFLKRLICYLMPYFAPLTNNLDRAEADILETLASYGVRPGRSS